MLLRPGRSQGRPRASEDRVGPLAQQSGHLTEHRLGVIEMDVPAARVGELGELLAVHDRVGPGLVGRTTLDGDLAGEVGRPGPGEIERTGAGSAAASSSNAAPVARAMDARACATSAAVAATSSRELS
jgi:hypothetical protein